MNPAACPHCGQQHQPGATFCPQTGRPMGAAPTPQGQPPAPQPPQAPPQHAPPQPGGWPQGAPPPYGVPPGQGQPAYPQPPYAQPAPGQPFQPQPPYAPPPYAPPGQAQPQYGQAPPYAQPQPGGFGAGKSVGVILTEAMQLYQKNLAALLLTSAVLIAPVSLAKSAAIALMLAPTAVADVAVQTTAAQVQKSAADWQREIQAAKGDPKKLAQVTREQQQQLQSISRNVVATEGAVVGGVMAAVLGLLAVLVGVALLYGIAVPLVTGALTIVVADRATGGHAGPWQAYGLLFKRLPKLISAWIPGFLLVLLGLCLCVLPGLVAGFFFTFAAPVVLLEGLGGTAALRRSVTLVKANAGQVFVVGLVFAVLRLVSGFVVRLFVPSTEFFINSLVEDALLLFLLPVPIVGTVLLYLDIRRQADGLDERGVRAGIEGLRRA